ncbi:hypothetical protein [Chitinophaga tropicalis]|uniref:Uncharacterized protein n=1 Tax=Chitinophaga tropicalis TaxID=2683588 RepID=A0A7K1U7V4_9BACT|nr:hypothetical protein [Chitinophaga tropicalis]MVT10444.1 hypothetical protein [Chitinophaga tropicalis]
MRKYYLLSGLFAILALPVCAQSGKPKTPAKKPATAATKTNLRFRSTWGVFLSDTLPRPEILKLLDSALVVRDEKNNKYPVVSFRFTYERKEPYLNDTTGKPGFYSEFVGDDFTGNKLPEFWSTRLKEMLERNEVLIFDNIIIRYTGDKLYRAPQLRFKVL